jgi:site-specific DNA-methyltransferase (adenine-specific)
MLNQILVGDNAQLIKTVPDSYVNTIITSPPYYGLRDYGNDAQLGLESTPDEYISKLVKLFNECRRVLKDDGTLWVNLGDSYDKDKNLYGMPWRLALALKDDGWILRQDIIWSKTNPMPEPVKDRCVKSHEYIFMLSKCKIYYFDYESIQEQAVRTTSGNKRRLSGAERGAPSDIKGALAGSASWSGTKRNKRSVWSVSVKSFKEAHFATFPLDLITPCILAGCPVDGVVFDPFMGAGTTAVASKQLQRNYLGIELNPEYVQISEKRLEGDFLF